MGDVAPVIEGGPLFHLIHTPVVWQDQPTWKATASDPRWARVRDLVGERLWAGLDTAGDCEDGAWSPSGTDGRARLDGAVLLQTPTHPGGAASPMHVCFELACFLRNVSWRRACFGEGASFAGALFEDDAIFEECRFLNACGFEGTQFLRTAMFRKARFGGVSCFAGSRFVSDVRFDAAKFQRLTELGACEFVGHAVFDETRFASVVRFAPSNLCNASFVGTKFEKEADFNKCELGANSRFERIWFAKVHVIARIAFAIFVLLFLVATLCAWAAWLTREWYLIAIAIGLGGVLLFWALTGASWIAGGNRALTQMAVDFRRMKAICDEQKNGRAEAVFHALELKAMRLQRASTVIGNVISKPVERLVSMIYEGSSNYGLSIGRPLVWFVASLLAFAALYWVWDLTGFKNEGLRHWAPIDRAWIGAPSTADPDYLDALTFSAGRIIPISLPVEQTVLPPRDCGFQRRFLAAGSRLSGEECMPDWIDPADKQALSLHRLLTRLAIGAQTLISGILIFLIGLGIRRRFQTD